MVPGSNSSASLAPRKNQFKVGDKCYKCNGTVINGIQCDFFDSWWHFKCKNLPDSEEKMWTGLGVYAQVME